MIILRYLCREVFHSMLAIVGILLVIVLSQAFVQYLTYAANGKLPLGLVISMIGIKMPTLMALLIPISFFLAIIITYGRLFADNELLVMFACGLSWRRLLKITFIPVAILAIAVAYLSLYLMPYMALHKGYLKQVSAAQEGSISNIPSGRFVALHGSDEFVYITNVNDKNQATGLFLYRAGSKPHQMQIVTSPIGYTSMDKEGNTYFILKNGRQYQVTLGQKNVQFIDFNTFATRIANPIVQLTSNQLTATSTANLLKSSNDAKDAELQWRLALPIGLIVMTFMAVAICYVEPRRGRYSKIFAAIMVVIIYFNGLSVARSLIRSGDLPGWLGMWIVHIAFLVIALTILWWRDGKIWFKRKKEGKD